MYFLHHLLHFEVVNVLLEFHVLLALLLGVEPVLSELEADIFLVLFFVKSDIECADAVARVALAFELAELLLFHVLEYLL